MFHNLPAGMLERMGELEKMHAADPNFTKQVPPETGKFLALLAAGAPPGTWLELGTSCGYSAMWISLACRLRGTRLVTVDHDPEKVKIARETFARAGVEDVVEVVLDDSIEQLHRHDDIGFCFIDAGGGIGTYEIVVPKLKNGGLLVYDNVISHGAVWPVSFSARERARPTVEKALADSRVDALVVPIGHGELVCRRCA